MKKLLVILAIPILAIGIAFLLLTGPVKVDPFVTSGYFKATMQRIDSLKKLDPAKTDSIAAGFAKVSISPTVGNSSDDAATGKFKVVPLAGFGARKGKSATGVHDSIFVRAIAFQSGKSITYFVGADLLIFPPDIIDRTVDLLAKAGIARNQLVFFATHTHSSLGAWGSGFIAEQFAGKPNAKVQQWLVGRIVAAVELAGKDLTPAEIAYGSFDASAFTRNRFTGDLGLKNNDFTYLLINQKGKRKAAIGSFSGHATTQGANNMQFSGDYPGYWERKMEKSVCDVAVFAAGSVGSQSAQSKGAGFESARYLGESLADSVIARVPTLQFAAGIPFRIATLRMTMPEYHIRLTPRINLSSWLSNKLMPEPQNVYLQALRIGNLVWMTAPADFSGEFAVQLKNGLARKGFGGLVTSFNGSYVGYVVPGKYFYMDEYEPKLMGWFGPTNGDYFADVFRYLSDVVIQ
ncbi:MAG: neutral/alkaline non-lysosomal ceramidase N-terminal domain-containing protein [Marinilabiliales bacterium]|nr:neutral/alkaline non-lysosomal ceramidase N-terminal domain-containing protein [Marinilabiliales bacterium]